jgi:hypothetical protein
LARVGDVRGDVVDDGDSSGTGGVAGDGVYHRRLLRRLTNSGGEIGRLWWLMWSGEWTRRTSERRGCWRCEEIERGGPPLIGAGGATALWRGSTMERALQSASELGEGVVLFSMSWRFSWW